MNRPEVTTILKEAITDEGLSGYLVPADGEYDVPDAMIDYRTGDDRIFLNGNFTIREIEALNWYLQNE